MNISNQPIRVRIAPSPTGPFHIGTARAALFNYLFAKKNKGQFLIRIEDTDRQRSTKASEEEILAGLKWLGLEADEPIVWQTENLNLHKKYLEQLRAENKIYPCFCSKEELELERAQQTAQKLPPKYSGKCRQLSIEEQKKLIDADKSCVWRLKIMPEKISFDDLIRGKIEEDTALMSDLVVAKNFNEPLFLFSNVVDDFAMKITHVIRGEDHISNTPKQILLYRALNFPLPQFGHLPLLLNKDRSKMSKRDQGAFLNDLKSAGFLSEAIVNYIALLGWNPGNEKEFFTIEELQKEFSLERVRKSASIFDYEKLLWFNSHYLHEMPIEKLAEQILPIIDFEINEDKKYFQQCVEAIRGRLKNLTEAPTMLKFFFIEPEVSIDLILNEKMQVDKSIAQKALTATIEALEKLTDFNLPTIEEALKNTIAELGFKNGQVLWPIRASLSGTKFSPGAFEIATILGKERTLIRLKKSLTSLNK